MDSGAGLCYYMFYYNALKFRNVRALRYTTYTAKIILSGIKIGFPCCWTSNIRFRIDFPTKSQDRAVGIVTGYGLDDRGVTVRVPIGSRIISSPRRPDRLWAPPSLLSNGYRGPSLGVKRPGVKLTTHLQLVPRPRKRGYIYPLPHKPSWRSI
jgi:hypothetical protein